MEIKDDPNPEKSLWYRTKHLEIWERMNVNQSVPPSYVEPGKKPARGEQEESVLEKVTDPPASNDRHGDSVHLHIPDFFVRRFPRIFHRNDINFVARCRQRFGRPAHARICWVVRVYDVTNPHRNPATVMMTARQTATSNAQRTRTISHSRSRFQRMTAWAND